MAGELSYLAVHLLAERASAGRQVPAHTAPTPCPALATLLPSGTLPFFKVSRLYDCWMAWVATWYLLHPATFLGSGRAWSSAVELPELTVRFPGKLTGEKHGAQACIPVPWSRLLPHSFVPWYRPLLLPQLLALIFPTSWFWSCMRYLSHWSDKGNGREGVSGSQFDYLVHWSGEDMEVGAWGSWRHHSQVRKQRIRTNKAELTFFFSVSPDPSPWNDPSHTQGESSNLNYPKQCIFHTVCILGDSGPCQGDDLFQSSQVTLSVHVLSASRWRLVRGHEPSCSEQSYVTLLH